MFKKNTVHNITTLESPKEHPVAAKIGTIIGRVGVPLALFAGTVYVVNKTQNV